MFKYIKKYLHFAFLAALFMIGEVSVDLIQPGLMSQIVDDGVLGLNQGGIGDPQLIFKLGVMMVGLVLFGAASGALNNMFVHKTGQNIGNDMRKDCFHSIMRFSFAQMDQFGTGSLVTRVTNDITQVQTFVSQFVRGMIRDFMLMAGSIYFMFRLNRQFGLILLCSFPFILGAMILCMRKAYPLLPRLQSQLDDMNSIMQEDVAGIRIIKACVREVYEKLRFGKANEAQIKTQLQLLLIFAFMNPFMNALMYFVVVLILISGNWQVAAGTATPGEIMAAITYTTQMLNGILMLVMLFQNISKGVASWKRIKEVLDTQPQLKDGVQPETKGCGRIEFKDVSFAFSPQDPLVLNHLNLTIEPGETIAIMGATGCGKTSMVNLIPRFYDVSAGEILIDGVNVKDYSQQKLREKIAIVLQKSELFSTTIAENIRWGKPEAAIEEVIEASRIAQANSFIEGCSEGYDTMVAERGMSLSGGQKQRVSISRAIIKPAEILIFDDSTSALDLKTEAQLYAALRKARPEATKIVIAQRIASVRQADRIVVLNNGTIEACGTHEELLKTSRSYQEVYESQCGKEDELL